VQTFYGLIRIMNTNCIENEGHGLTLSASDSLRNGKSEILSEISIRQDPANHDSIQDNSNKIQKIWPTLPKISYE